MAQTRKNSSAKKSEQAQQTWNEISGIMRVFGNDFEYKRNGKTNTIRKWSVSVSSKDESGEYTNYYIPVKFRTKESNEPEDAGLHTIDVAHAFFTVDTYTTKDKDVKNELCLVVVENEIVD